MTFQSAVLLIGLKAQSCYLNEVLAPSSGLQSGIVLVTGWEWGGRQNNAFEKSKEKNHCDKSVFVHH